MRRKWGPKRPSQGMREAVSGDSGRFSAEQAHRSLRRRVRQAPSAALKASPAPRSTPVGSSSVPLTRRCCMSRPCAESRSPSSRTALGCVAGVPCAPGTSPRRDHDPARHDSTAESVLRPPPAAVHADRLRHRIRSCAPPIRLGAIQIEPARSQRINATYNTGIPDAGRGAASRERATEVARAQGTRGRVARERCAECGAQRSPACRIQCHGVPGKPTGCKQPVGTATASTLL